MRNTARCFVTSGACFACQYVWNASRVRFGSLWRQKVSLIIASGPFVEREECRTDKTRESGDVVPSYRFAEIEDREHAEHDQRDHLLHGLELCGGINLVAEPVAGHREAILEERDAPGNRDHDPERCRRELELPVPGEGHEYIRNAQQKDGSDHRPGHGCISGLISGWNRPRCSNEACDRTDLQAGLAAEDDEKGARAKISPARHLPQLSAECFDRVGLL